MDIKEFFGTDWKSMMSEAALKEVAMLNKMPPSLRAEEGCKKWEEEGPFKDELKWNLWAKAYKDDFLIDIEEGEEDVLGNGKRQANVLDSNYFVKKEISFNEKSINGEYERFNVLCCDFSDFIFPGLVSFVNCEFHSTVDFNGVQFLSTALFHNAIFCESVMFEYSIFTGFGNFRNTIFKSICSFSSSIFYAGVGFESAQFDDVAFFHSNVIVKYAEFKSCTFKQDVDFDNTFFLGESDFSFAKCAGNLGFYKNGFGSVIYYTGEELDLLPEAEKLICKLKLREKTLCVPDFIGLNVSVIPDLSYTKIKYHPDMKDSHASAKFRKLKEMAAQTSNHSRELEYFREELIHKPYSGEATKLTSLLIRLYEYSSRCGTSALLPALWLLNLIFWAPILYVYLSPSITWTELSGVDLLIYVKYSLHQSLPFLAFGGEEKDVVVEYLYGAYDKIPNWTGFFSGVQKAISLTLEFLIGLGIRNYYRM